jgi:spore coat protein U-like protein
VKIRIPIALAAALFMAQAPAFAGSSPTTFTVKAKVDANCTISATDLDFGSYDPLVANKTVSAPLDAQTSVAVLCTKGSSPVTVGLNTGTHATRFMSNGTDSLQYELYSDVAGGTVWGNSGGALVTWGAFGSIASQGTGVSRTVYGRIPGGQDVSVGSYTDTITATVNF